MADNYDADVIILGGGPTGLMAAADLGRRGHAVILIERHAGPFGLPRAGHVDGEAVRILQSVGAHTALLADATPYGDYTWYSGSGETLFVMNFGERSSSHWFSDYTMYQPHLERGLLEAVAEAPAVQLRYGWEAIDVRQDASGAAVDIAPRAESGMASGVGSVQTLTARYVLAADGAGSPTRERLGIRRHDHQFEAETWLIVDAEILERWAGEGAGAQYCDPRRPAFETPLGRRHHRWEFSLLPGESDEEYLDPEKAWELLGARGIGRDQVRIVRQQVYRFESRTAERWRDGRVLLLGDAAHTMAPFMGQGLCAGLRDVSNLGWKLDLVLRGAASDSLLDSYEVERRPHAQAWADISRAVGAISCTLDPVTAAERDAAYARGEVEPPPPFPVLASGIIAAEPAVAPDLVGRVFPQNLVRRGHEVGLFDDVVGCVFTLVVGGPEPVEVGSEHRSAIARLGGVVVDLGRPEERDAMIDIDGAYYRYFQANGIGAVIVRPDRYVFGSAVRGDDVTALLGRLESEVLVTASVTA